MRKGVMILLCSAMMMSSCGTNSRVEDGAGNGAVFGYLFGSAFGGIFGGPRGSDVGAVMGMAGGAMVGAAIGSAVDKMEKTTMERIRRSHDRRGSDDSDTGYDRRGGGNNDASAEMGYDIPAESGFDPTNSGDDRIEFDGAQPSGEIHVGHNGRHGVHSTVPSRTVSVEQLMQASPAGGIRLNPLIEIRRASFVDADGDGVISRGEQCRVSFEIMNNSSETIYDVRPAVAETTGNKHIHVSKALRVDSIRPHRGIRYTATVAADDGLKNGETVIKVGVARGDDEVASQMQEFRVETRKKAAAAAN